MRRLTYMTLVIGWLMCGCWGLAPIVNFGKVEILGSRRIEIPASIMDAKRKDAGEQGRAGNKLIHNSTPTLLEQQIQDMIKETEQ